MRSGRSSQAVRQASVQCEDILPSGIVGFNIRLPLYLLSDLHIFYSYCSEKKVEYRRIKKESRYSYLLALAAVPVYQIPRAAHERAVRLWHATPARSAPGAPGDGVSAHHARTRAPRWGSRQGPALLRIVLRGRAARAAGGEKVPRAVQANSTGRACESLPSISMTRVGDRVPHSHSRAHYSSRACKAATAGRPLAAWLF